MKLTQARLKELLHYNPRTGQFTWLQNRGRVSIGTIAGTPDKDGYILIRVDYIKYKAHRLVFLYMTGKMPREEVDHVEHNPADNRLSKLQETTRIKNCRNVSIQSRNKSGVTGVFWSDRLNKWCARIRVNREDFWLGVFTQKQKAIKARRAAERRYGFHPNHGR